MHVSGFQNGIQSADEARQQLESVLERLKEEHSLEDKINSSKTSQESIKQVAKKRKPATKRKHKKEESVENSPAWSGPLSKISADVESIDNESISEPVIGKRKRKRTEGEPLESPQFSLSNSSSKVFRLPNFYYSSDFLKTEDTF